MVFKPAVAYLLACAVLSAQCPPPVSQPVVPSLPTYISSLQSSIAAMRAQISGLPQPPIQLNGQNVYGVAGVLETGHATCTPYYYNPALSVPPSPACAFDNYLIQRGYLQALKNAGVGTVDVNVDLTGLGSSPEYGTALSALGISGSINTQCGTGHYLTLGYPSPGYDTPPTLGASFYCYELAVIDDMIYYANHIGLKVRLAPSPGATTSACTFTPPVTSTELENCYDPLYYAAIQRWNYTSGSQWIDSLTVIHEPDGVWGDEIPGLTPGAVNGFVSAANSAIILAESNNGTTCPGSSHCTKVGAAIQTQANNSSEAGYWADWLTTLTQPLNYMAQDIYPNTWDASVYAAQGRWLCQVSAGSGDTECPAVLIPCTPSATNDPNNECQWTVPSSITAQSGAVLASAVPGAPRTGSSVHGEGSCPATFANGATAIAGIASNTVNTLSITNVGAGFTAIPSTVTVSACTGVTITPSTGAILNVASGTLANYAVGGALSLALSLAQTAQAAGMPVRVNETNRPVWVASGCAPPNASGVYDPAYVEWQSDGMDVAWMGAFTAWAAANGYTSVSPYNSQILSWYNSWNTNQCTSGCPNPLTYAVPFFAQPGYALATVGSGTVPLGVATPAESMSGAFWQRLASGSSASLQGQGSIQGAGHLGK